MASNRPYTHFIPAVPENPDYEAGKRYVLIEDLEQLSSSFKPGGLIAWDTETTGLNPEESEIVGFSYTYDGITGYYCPVSHFDLALGRGALDLFYKALRGARGALLYNARFDIRMMEYSGYDMSFMYPKDPVTGASHPLFMDVMNQVWLSDTNVLMPSLKASSLHFLGFRPPKFAETLGSEVNFQYVPARSAYRYACLDAINTYNLHRATYRFHQECPQVSQMDNAVIYIIGQLEKTALKIDLGRLTLLRDEVYGRVQALEQELYVLAGHTFNINSGRELTSVFMEQGIDTGERTEAGAMKTGIEQLSLYLLEHPDCVMLSKLIDYKKLFKFYNSYLKTLVQVAEQSGVRPPRFSYKLHGVPTGRLACVSGETAIPTVLGPIPIAELSRYADGNEVFIDHSSTAPFDVLYMGERDCLRLRLGNGHEIVATYDHLFMVPDGSWVKASALHAGSYLLSAGAQRLSAVQVESIYPMPYPVPVYTLRVHHPLHQYVSETLISHNCGKDGKNTYFSPINLQCLHGDTLVKADRGEVPIRSIRQGDLVFDGERYMPCELMGPGREQVYRVRTLWSEIRATLGHLFLTVNPETYKEEWHTLRACLHLRYPLVRDPECAGSAFDDVVPYTDSPSYYGAMELYSRSKFDRIVEAEPLGLSEVYDLHVPGTHRYSACGYIVHNSIPKPKSIKCFFRKATAEEIARKEDVLGYTFSPDHPEWSPGRVVEGMSQKLNVRSAFLPEHPEDGDYVVSIDMCLESGSPVQTKNGYMGISELKVGDFVLSPQGWVEVIRVKQTGVKKLIKVSPDNGGQAVYCSEDHPFIINGEKVEAKNIKDSIPSVSFNSYNKDIEDRKKITESLSPLLSIKTLKDKVNYIIENNLKGLLVEGLEKYTRANISRWSGVHLSSFGHVLEYLDLPKTGKEYRCKFDFYVTNPFTECTPTSSYLLGYIFGDGNISEKRKGYLTLNISSKDYSHLKRISELFGSDTKIRHNIKNGKEWFTLDIPNTELCETLVSLGVRYRKSYIGCDLPVSWLGDNLRHFIRGLLDSDGCVRHTTHSYLDFTLVGHDSYIKKLYEMFPDKWRYKYGDSISFMYLHGTKEDKRFIYSYLYEGATIWLQRKRDIIDKWYEDNFGDIVLPVWDITVDSVEHLYYVNGMVTHNCGEELRVVTNLAHEDSWARVINSGGDLHHANAVALFGPENYTKEIRKRAKACAFGMLYGQEYRGFQRKFPEMTLDEAQEFMVKFKKNIPHITRWQERMVKEARRTGTFYTGYGRPRRVKHYFTSPDYKDVAFGKRTVLNGPVQGTAADVLKVELVRLWDHIFTVYPEIKFICTIHDEINYSVPRSLAYEAIPIMIKCMTIRRPDWPVALDCSLSVGPSLGNIYPMKYNWETKEFEPDWEEDTRKPEEPEPDMIDLEVHDAEAEEEREHGAEKPAKEQESIPTKPIDSLMFSF